MKNSIEFERGRITQFISNSADEIAELKLQLETQKKQAKTVEEELKIATKRTQNLKRLSNEVAGNEEHLIKVIDVLNHSDTSKVLSELLKEVRGPAAAFIVPSEGVQEVNDYNNRTIINFSQKIYDTHGSVEVPANAASQDKWRFRARVAGIYAVSAYVAFDPPKNPDPQKNGYLTVDKLYLTLYKNGVEAVYMAFFDSFNVPQQVGGTTEICLKDNEYIDIRASTEVKSPKPSTMTSRLSWIRVHYVRLCE